MLQAGQNVADNMLRIRNIDFKNVFVDLTTSAETGINGQAYVHSLNYDSTRLDTITLNLQQKGDRLTYNGKVRNNRKNPQFVFNALFDGHVHQHGALIGVRYYDNRDRLGVRLGATAQMETGGIRLKLMPERPTIGYKEFNLNPDNYIFLGTDKRIAADINLMADDKTGLKIPGHNRLAEPLQPRGIHVSAALHATHGRTAERRLPHHTRQEPRHLRCQ